MDRLFAIRVVILEFTVTWYRLTVTKVEKIVKSLFIVRETPSVISTDAAQLLIGYIESMLRY